MYYVNIELSHIRGPEFMGATAEQQGAWLCLLSYCCEVENRGTIPNCADWTAMQWQRIVGVDEHLLRTDCGLWKREGPNLIVTFYPIRQQERFEKRRRDAAAGGRTRHHEAEAEGKGKGEGEYGASAGAKPPAQAPASVSVMSHRTQGSRRPRNPVDTYAGAEDYDDMRGFR